MDSLSIAGGRDADVQLRVRKVFDARFSAVEFVILWAELLVRTHYYSKVEMLLFQREDDLAKRPTFMIF